jgi:hypothetical protein
MCRRAGSVPATAHMVRRSSSRCSVGIERTGMVISLFARLAVAWIVKAERWENNSASHLQ